MENADREVYVGFFDNGGTAIAEVYVTLSPYENKELILTDYLTSEELEQLNSITVRKNRFLVPYVILQDDTGSYFDIIGPDFEGSY